MNKETFDFSEALRRMKEGKKVVRLGNPKLSYGISDDTIKLYPLDKDGHIIFKTGLYIDIIHCFDILAIDWQEVEG